MKKQYLLSVALIAPFFINSQITLTAENFATTHESQRMSRASAQSEIDLGTGENYHWDYSHLTATGQNVEEYDDVESLGLFIKAQFGSMVQAKYRANYYLPNPDLPLQNLPSILPIQISDLNEFFQLNQDSLSLVGSSVNLNGQGLPIRNKIIEPFYHFPLNYGDNYTSNGAFDKDMNPIFDAQWRQKREHKVTVDGWGKIRTPMGTFQALRIHHEIKEQDSLRASINGFGMWLPFTTRTGIYEWRTTADKNPVLRIKTIITGSNETVRSIEFRDNNVFVGVNELGDSQLIEVYPNPTKNQLFISTEAPIEDFSIYSMDGQLVALGKVVNQQINCTALSNGVYMVRLTGNDMHFHAKFVKE